MSLREQLARGWIQGVQSVRGWDYRAALAELEASQWQPRAEVEERNLERLRGLLAHCHDNVPFYRAAMQRLGFDPGAVRDVSALALLPVISKAELRADYGAFRAAGESAPTDVWASSGSTGAPFFFELDRRSIIANTFAALARGRRWWGLDHGVAEGMIWSGLSDLTGTASGRFAAMRRRVSWAMKNITTVDVYLLDDAAIERGYRAFLRAQPRVLRTIASGLLRFCVGLETMGLDGRRLGIEAAIYTGEGLTRAQRDRIERVLGCPTVCEYGCTELGIIAFECPQGGLHLSHENLIVEFLVEGRAATPGEVGELVITNLNDRVHPMLRYRVGDFAAPGAGNCPCGRSMPLLEALGGRVHDVVRTPRGRMIHGLFFTHLFDRLPEVSQFRVLQSRIDAVEIEIVVAPEAARKACDSVAAIMRDSLGEPMEVVVRDVPALPAAASGKTRWIQSTLGAGS